MQEQAKLQQIPVKVYRTLDRLMAAAPMPGLQPEDILVEVKEGGHLILKENTWPDKQMRRICLSGHVFSFKATTDITLRN